LLAWLTRLLWTSKPTRNALGLAQSFTERIRPRLDALTPGTQQDVAEEIRQDVVAILREGLADRGIEPTAYELVLGDEPSVTARIVRECDGCVWFLPDFDDFIDHGLYPRGSAVPEAERV
jgi:hypothetical protein